jgi:tripartite-type tricarboxylate transporter receptor subunit TctC
MPALPITQRTTFAAVVAACALNIALPAHAQTAYPTKPIRMIIPVAPGGSNDIVGRFVAQTLGARLGQQIVVDNRAGGSAIIGTDLVARGRPDGYTIGLASITHTMTPATHKKLPYDALKSFTPVGMIGSGPNVLVTGPNVQLGSVKELIALAKAKPGQVRYASTTPAGLHHFAGELFKGMAGIDVLHIPYKGGGPAMIDVISGQVETLIITVISGLPNIRAGRLKPLGVTSLKRTPVLPDVPTISEAGVPGYESLVWWGLLAPPQLPLDILNRLNLELTAVLRDPGIVKHLESQAAEPQITTPAEFRKFLASELAKWDKVARQSGIAAE